MKLVNIADLKSAAFGLAGSSPVPGTTLPSRDSRFSRSAAGSRGVGFSALNRIFRLPLLPDPADGCRQSVGDQVRIPLGRHDRLVSKDAADREQVNAGVD